jgi:peptide/nickel transport system substrate-binding protein
VEGAALNLGGQAGRLATVPMTCPGRELAPLGGGPPDSVPVMPSEKTPRAGAAALVALALAFGLTACGGDPRARGGQLRFVASSFPDHLDPQLATGAEAREATYNTYVPLLTFRHDTGQDGAEVVPGLAEDLPAISADGRTYTLELRQGLRYSDRTPVRASDFEHAVERLFDLGSGGAPLYAGIVGAADYEAGRSGSIAGIETDDASGAITIRLTKPDGEFEDKLAVPFAAPVPADTPATDQTSHPPPSTGPYAIASSDPPNRFVLERSPVWEDGNEELLPEVPTPYADRITQTVVADRSTQTTLVQRNRADFMVDPPPPSRLVEVAWAYTDRFRAEVTLSTYYFWMNTTRPPFDDLKVRQAVNYALDLRTLQRIYGALMAPTQQVVPPAVPGSAKFTLYPHDVKTAKRLIEEARPSDTKVTVWADDRESSERAGAYLQSVLERLGFRARLRTVDRERYPSVVGELRRPDLDAGLGRRVLELPHPNQLFGPLLNGRAIRETHNTNLARFDDPALDAEMDRLAGLPFDSGTQSDYGGLDRSVMEQAPWAPIGNARVTTFTSERIDFDRVTFNPVMHHDYGSFAIE